MGKCKASMRRMLSRSGISEACLRPCIQPASAPSQCFHIVFCLACDSFPNSPPCCQNASPPSHSKILSTPFGVLQLCLSTILEQTKAYIEKIAETSGIGTPLFAKQLLVAFSNRAKPNFRLRSKCTWVTCVAAKFPSPEARQSQKYIKIYKNIQLVTSLTSGPKFGFRIGILFWKLLPGFVEAAAAAAAATTTMQITNPNAKAGRWWR